MGTSTCYTGVLRIEPPLTWPEIRRSEAWPGHPDHANSAWGRIRYGATIHVVEETVETLEGTLVRRSGVHVEITGDELRHDDVMDDLRSLARLFGATHRFVGALDCRHDHPDVETPFRVVVDGTEVREIWPVMFWPDEGARDTVRAALGQHSGVDLDAADDIAARLLAALIRAYTKEG